jgi:N-hydroxyarylamine O-acetyltransferase
LRAIRPESNVTRESRRLRSIVRPSIVHPSIDLLRSLHRARLFTVPVQNLDIRWGREFICDEVRIRHKVVNEHRGGFCYELEWRFRRPTAEARSFSTPVIVPASTPY